MKDEENGKLFNVIPIIQPDPARTMPIIVGIVVIIFVTVIALFIKSVVESSQPKINLVYAPTTALVTIDGKITQAGEIVLSPGAHEIKAEKFGFDSETVTVEAEPGKTKPVSIVLTPNREETGNWYNEHEEDGRVVDGAIGYEYDADSKEMLKDYPIIGQLPIINESFKIYQQGCDEPICVLIDADKSQYNAAIEYFREKLDSDIGKYRFVYTNYSNPFLGEG